MTKYKKYDPRLMRELCGKLLTLAYLQELLGRAKLILIVYKNEAGQSQVWLWRN